MSRTHNNTNKNRKVYPDKKLLHADDDYEAFDAKKVKVANYAEKGTSVQYGYMEINYEYKKGEAGLYIQTPQLHTSGGIYPKRFEGSSGVTHKMFFKFDLKNEKHVRFIKIGMMIGIISANSLYEKRSQLKECQYKGLRKLRRLGQFHEALESRMIAVLDEDDKKSSHSEDEEEEENTKEKKEIPVVNDENDIVLDETKEYGMWVTLLEYSFPDQKTGKMIHRKAKFTYPTEDDDDDDEIPWEELTGYDFDCVLLLHVRQIFMGTQLQIQVSVDEGVVCSEPIKSQLSGGSAQAETRKKIAQQNPQMAALIKSKLAAKKAAAQSVTKGAKKTPGDSWVKGKEAMKKKKAFNSSSSDTSSESGKKERVDKALLTSSSEDNKQKKKKIQISSSSDESSKEEPIPKVEEKKSSRNKKKEDEEPEIPAESTKKSSKKAKDEEPESAAESTKKSSRRSKDKRGSNDEKAGDDSQ